MAVLLKGIGGTREARLTRHRVLVNPKAAYGWITRRPTKSQMKKLDNMVIRHRIAQRINRGLRMVMEGGNTALESIINQRQVGIIATRMGKGDTPTHQAKPVYGSLQKEMKKNLEEIGLEEISKWHWQHKEVLEEEDQ